MPQNKNKHRRDEETIAVGGKVAAHLPHRPIHKRTGDSGEWQQKHECEEGQAMHQVVGSCRERWQRKVSMEMAAWTAMSGDKSLLYCGIQLIIHMAFFWCTFCSFWNHNFLDLFFWMLAGEGYFRANYQLKKTHYFGGGLNLWGYVWLLRLHCGTDTIPPRSTFLWVPQPLMNEGERTINALAPAVSTLAMGRRGGASDEKKMCNPCMQFGRRKRMKKESLGRVMDEGVNCQAPLLVSVSLPSSPSSPSCSLHPPR